MEKKDKEKSRFWKKFFLPPCFGPQYDGRTMRCSHCEFREPCGKAFEDYIFRVYKWFEALDNKLAKEDKKLGEILEEKLGKERES